MRLHGAFGLDGAPRGIVLWAADRPEREVAADLLPWIVAGAEAIGCDKANAGAEFEAGVRGSERWWCGRRGATSPKGIRLAAIRRRVESIYQTLKDILTLERHGARTMEGLRVRIAQRLLALAACVYVNHWLGRPGRSLVAFTS